MVGRNKKVKLGCAKNYDRGGDGVGGGGGGEGTHTHTRPELMPDYEVKTRSIRAGVAEKMVAC